MLYWYTYSKVGPIFSAYMSDREKVTGYLGHIEQAKQKLLSVLYIYSLIVIHGCFLLNLLDKLTVRQQKIEKGKHLLYTGSMKMLV